MKIATVIFVYQREGNIEHLYESALNSASADIYFYLDGPKSPKEEIQTKCIKRRICSLRDFDRSKLITRKENLGLKLNILSALDEIMDSYDAVIVLEDDLRLSKMFFAFMEMALLKYRDSEDIGSIHGCSFLERANNVSHINYYKSRYTHSWGWATWKRCWKKFDAENVLKQKNLVKQIRGSNFGRSERLYWLNAIWMCKRGFVDSWAYPWSFFHFFEGIKAIAPSVNLVANSGFDGVSTHTKKYNEAYAYVQFEDQLKIGVELQSYQSRQNDEEESKILYNTNACYYILNRIKNVLLKSFI